MFCAAKTLVGLRSIQKKTICRALQVKPAVLFCVFSVVHANSRIRRAVSHLLRQFRHGSRPPRPWSEELNKLEQPVGVCAVVRGHMFAPQKEKSRVVFLGLSSPALQLFETSSARTETTKDFQESCTQYLPNALWFTRPLLPPVPNTVLCLLKRRASAVQQMFPNVHLTVGVGPTSR